MSNMQIKIGVCPTLEDPFFQEARSRILWAASTSDAINRIGHQSYLIGNATQTLIPYEKNPHWISSEIESFYGVGNIDLLPVFEPNKYWTKGRFEFLYDYLLPKIVLPHVQIIHTRDPYLARIAIENGKGVIFEDHDESCQSSQRALITELLPESNFKALICITPYILNVYKEMGVDIDKMLVMDSGVNTVPIDYIAKTKPHHSGLVLGYAGGLQEERDIDLLIKAAARFKHITFLFIGGRGKLTSELEKFAEAEGATNIDFLGYMKFEDMRKVMMSRCHGLIYSRSTGKHEENSSPLKLFDYFNYGKPVISASTLTTKKYLGYEGVFSYQPSNLDSFIEAVNALEKFLLEKKAVSPNLKVIAESKSWLNRQVEILEFAGVI